MSSLPGDAAMATACVEKAPRKGYVIYSREESEDFVFGAAGTDAGYIARQPEDTVAEPARVERAPERETRDAGSLEDEDRGGSVRGSWAGWLGFAKRGIAEKPCRFVHLRVAGLETAALPESAEMAERVRGILERYAPVVRTDGPDGFVLDFAGLKGVGFDLRATITRIPGEIAARMGLAARVGAGSSRAMATIASRKARTGGVVVVAQGNEKLFLAGLPVTELIEFPTTVLRTLADSGISTVGRLRAVPKAVLAATFGSEISANIWQAARGLDCDAPSNFGDRILRDLTIEPDGSQHVSEMLGYLARRVALAIEDAGAWASEIGLLVRYADERCERRSFGFLNATRDEGELRRAAERLFLAMGTHGSPICRLGLEVRVPVRGMAVPRVETRERTTGASGQLVTATA
jgi:nucleotidyltransferase/DNA polymerase involved in DNA repair